ncbi:MAG: HPr family phosphocarrier protein [Caldilineaceae bacterium SB0670_bin_27]|uniref:HPr family phosphocarrier protein n=1 Tax=Caldilineaceae bacterium SB0664_bin_27 TaxID=2605260 RepID=A0A6B0YW98_9CHLR|nr:HPr family phosphocarrier protein [Caldilineaceae bacterium SB0664_bin_27]MYJ78089.1 HPr family phosphocarrier protein [Caldilineaceae bacterium SB0670_bin_27]
MEHRSSQADPLGGELEGKQQNRESGLSGNAYSPLPDGCPEHPEAPLQASRSVVVTVSDPRGLHLRSGRDVVRIASRFQASITAANLSRNTSAVDLKSILQLLQLQARQGHSLHLAASGPDADAAIEALCSLF